jgi:membrane protein YqaA with SNARE-associated domain
MRLSAQRRVDVLGRLLSSSDRRLRVVILIVGVGAVTGATVGWLLAGDVSDVERWKGLGYPGVFFLNFLSSVALVLPVPGLFGLCGASFVLNPLALGILAAIGETVGEISGYAIGYGGRSAVEDRRFYAKIRTWMERRGTAVIFFVSIIPNPVFDLVGIAAGGVRFPLRRFLVAVWVGKTIKDITWAYACSYYGLPLLRWVDSYFGGFPNP